MQLNIYQNTKFGGILEVESSKYRKRFYFKHKLDPLDIELIEEILETPDIFTDVADEIDALEEVIETLKEEKESISKLLGDANQKIKDLEIKLDILASPITKSLIAEE